MVVTVKDAEAFVKQMAQPDLVFLTKDNQARLEAEARAIIDAQKLNPPLVPPEQLGCPHGREVGVPCPHCLGVSHEGN